MNSIPKLTCSTGALLAIVACVSHRPATLGQEFRGYWQSGERGTSFQPCGSTEKWMPEFDSSLSAAATVETTLVFEQQAPSSKAPAPIPQLPPSQFRVVRGETSAVGSYGVDGYFHRRLLVHQFGDTTGHCS
jgi:hypothetical protein